MQPRPFLIRVSSVSIRGLEQFFGRLLSSTAPETARVILRPPPHQCPLFAHGTGRFAGGAGDVTIERMVHVGVDGGDSFASFKGEFLESAP